MTLDEKGDDSPEPNNHLAYVRLDYSSAPPRNNQD